MDPALRSTLFIRGQVDAVAFFTGLTNLQTAGLPLNQMLAFVYAEHGPRSHGNVIVVNPALATQSPRALQGCIRASTRSWLDCIDDPDAGGRAVKPRGALAD